MILAAPHTWIELNSTLFNQNVAAYRKILGNTAIFAAVIKSNGYGHGEYQMGLLCDANPAINWLCTSNLSEALTLRALGIKKPLLVLGFIDEDPRKALHTQIALPVYDIATLNELSALGAQERKAFSIHIKIDTGMSRFGFYPEQALAAITQAKSLPFINLDGIFTHCAEPNSQEYTRYQLDQFSAVCTQATAAGIDIPYKHASNSAVTGAFMADYPELNVARIGAGIYGFWHSEIIKKQIQEQHPGTQLQPILSWKTKVGPIREIPAHTPVGYDRTYITSRTTKIAVIPVGYYESYDRKLYTQDRFVLIKNQYAPVIGRVCMNATIIDITDLQDVHSDDEAILIGDYTHLRAAELVTLIGNANPREVITRLMPSITRVIIPELTTHAQETPQPAQRKTDSI
ncbi:alanine racemase [Candidatus Dependentiae bacterium HGW-Dependentiae-1]|nr:MAG: alanine racemase [Candidatus Dependentiae bacterium HGW-Dependentiae-1]